MAERKEIIQLSPLHGFTSLSNSFIGRSAEVLGVSGLLREFRMVTVTGAGGIGKTRLADKVARDVTSEFADGVWLVELASVRDPSLIAAQVAATLQLTADDPQESNQG